MAAAWPERAGDPFADQMNALEEVRGVADADTGRPDVEHDAAVARQRGRRHRRAARARTAATWSIWGSASLVRTLLAEGLVDELNLLIEPILLGGGKRIFPDDGTARPMQLVKSVTAATGVQVCTYRPAS